MSDTLNILLVDDEPSIRLVIGDALRARGYRVRLGADGAEALTALDEERFDIVVSDIQLPEVGGLDLLRKIRHESPLTHVLLITAFATVSDAVAALKAGAADYVTKPFSVDELLERVSRLALHRSVGRAAGSVESTDTAQPVMIGRSLPILRLLEQVETFARSDAPVMILGESGTGKELVAQLLHDRSRRRDRPFVAVNCAAFPETLLESELFGVEKGAFTGATKSRMGRFQSAQGGTLFLDEVAEIPIAAQAKLLRVIQTGMVERLGTNQSVAVDVRIMCATHQNLKSAIAGGTFREDLYYRLRVLDLEVPPLRARKSDLPALIDHFIRRFSVDGHFTGITPRAVAALADYSFPGNVRELEHMVHRAVVLADGAEIDLEHLPSEISGRVVVRREPTDPGVRKLVDAAQEFEREYLVRALRLSHGRKTKAAEMLGISRKSLWEKLRRLGISELEYADDDNDREGGREAQKEEDGSRR